MNTTFASNTQIVPKHAKDNLFDFVYDWCNFFANEQFWGWRDFIPVAIRTMGCYDRPGSKR
jgi:hypothetical protein